MRGLGQGKYDEVLTAVREECAARGVVLYVIDGRNGSGLGVQIAPEIAHALPTVLHDVAKEVARRTRGGKPRRVTARKKVK